ncbi:MAG: PKD domain-containing protein, partial [Candidatus Limnocylindrales bacterium]
MHTLRSADVDLVRDEIGTEEDLMRMGRVGRFCALASLVVAGAGAMPASALADGNVAPTVTAYAINTTFAEPMIEVGMALISDPDSSSFTCSINFGDGTPAVPGIVSGTLCSWPEHRYIASGTYTIVVTVTDDWGASGEGTVAVTYTNAAPGVAVPALFGTPQAGSPVHASAVFLDFGTGDDAGTPVFETYTCAFDYGDGSGVQTGTYVPRSPGQFPTCVGPDHVYQAPGAYAITATVTDSGGAAGSSQTTVTIASVPDSGPVLTVPPTSHPMVTEGFPVTLPWALVDPAPDLPYSMHVNWGDGSSEDLTSATSPAEIDLTHTYAASDRVGAPGYSLYTATLTLTDARGATASASQQVTVINLAPQITAPATITVPEGPATTVTLATFTDASVGPWQVYVSTSDGRFLHLTYQTPSAIQVPWDPSWGNLTVTISVWDRGLMGSTATVSIVMGNSAPAVGVISFYHDTQPAEGQLFAAVATFTDPGLSSWPASETYTCTVNYGDGTGPQAGGVDGGIC